MKIENPHLRLLSLWGHIDRQHNELIASRVIGKRILDVGCGYGALVEFLRRRGYDTVGIDFNEACITAGKSLFPQANLRLANAEELNAFDSDLFDPLVLKDCLHHLVGEGDVRKAFQQFRRILKRQGRIIILDPNPQFILRVARKIIFHLDPEATPELAKSLLVEEGFSVRGLVYYEVLGLALSGGYVGPRLVPNLTFLNRTVAISNRLLSSCVTRLGAGRHICWRYLVYADRLDGDR